MYCPNCGAKLDTPNQETCRYCGADLRLQTEASQPQISAEKETTTKKYSKTCFTVALTSFILALGTTIVGIAFYLSLRAAYQSIFGMKRYGNTIFPSWNVLPTQTAVGYLHVIGTSIIILSLVGFSLASISLLLRKKAVSYDPMNKLIRIALVFGILGIISAIIGIIFGIILYNAMPFHSNMKIFF
jgi:hypothetical protein